MKSQWQSARDAMRVDDRPRPEHRRSTSLQRLARRYWLLACIALVAGTGSWSVYELAGEELAISYALLMLVLSLTDFAFYYAVTRIDPASMRVEEVYRRAMALRKRHLQTLLFSVPAVLGWIAWLAWSSLTDRTMVAAITAGAAVGAVIGLNALRRFMNDYREAME